MPTINFTVRNHKGHPIENTAFKITAGVPDTGYVEGMLLPAAVTAATDELGKFTVVLPYTPAPYYVSTADNTVGETVAYKLFVPNVTTTLDAEMLYVDVGLHQELLNDRSLAALIDAKVSVHNRTMLINETMLANYEALTAQSAFLAHTVATVPWDLTVESSNAELSVYEFIAPMAGVYTNGMTVENSIYSMGFSTGNHIGAAFLAELPMTGKYYFYWKPTAGYNTGTATSLLDIFPVDLLTAGLLKAGVSNSAPGLSVLDLIIDPLFTLGQTALFELDLDAGEIYVSTDNLPRYLAGPITPTAGYFIGVSGSITASGTLLVVGGSLGVGTFGSLLVPAVGFVPLQSYVLPGIPAEVQNGQVLHVTAGGTFDGVEYAAGEGALVVDKTIPELIPIVRDTFVEPSWVPSLSVTVGPGGTYTKLESLNADLVAAGYSGNTLQVQVLAGHTFTASTVVLAFPGFREVSITLAEGVYAPTLALSAHNVSLSGTWHVNTFTGRGITLAADAIVTTEDALDISGLTVQSTTAELHTVAGTMTLENVGAALSAVPNTLMEFHVYPGAEYVALLGHNNCELTVHHAYVKAVRGATGNVSLHYTAEVGDVSPAYLLYVDQGAVLHSPELTNTVDVAFEIATAVHINKGIFTGGTSSGYFTTYCNLTQGTPVAGGLYL